MDALSHIFLHVTFCAAMMKAPVGTTIPVHVTMAYRNGVKSIDKTFPVVRDGKDAVLEYDVPGGIYRLIIEDQKFGCARVDYLHVLDGLNRNVSETLADLPLPAQANVALLDGTAPPSFSYLKPTFVFFQSGLTCDQPITTQVPVRTEVEYDPGSYHIWLYADPALLAKGPLVAALRIPTTTGAAHYLRVKLPFPAPWYGFALSYQLDIREDIIDIYATAKVDTLLCPKIFETSVG